MNISLIMAYYDNPIMLGKQFEVIASYPPVYKNVIEYIVVDDASPRWPAVDVKRPAGLPPFSLYRIKKDIPWNQDAARNIGVHHSNCDWILLTDMDHIVPVETMHYIFTSKLDKKAVYQFARVSAPDMEPYKSHPNSWLMRREMYDKIGGYDERFAGYYGTDGEFRSRVVKKAPLSSLIAPLIRVPRDVIADASTTTYMRKDPKDKETIYRIFRSREMAHGWKTVRLSFPYEQVL